jgi:hypothetical protein
MVKEHISNMKLIRQLARVAAASLVQTGNKAIGNLDYMGNAKYDSLTFHKELIGAAFSDILANRERIKFTIAL